MSRGVYSLLIQLGQKRSIISRSGLRWHLQEGHYVYTGSAMGNSSTSLEKRLERHLKVRKRCFWHIDKLLDGSAKVVSTIYAKTASRMECKVNKKISSVPHASPIKGFGSSDCRFGCIGHLIFLNSNSDDLIMLLRGAYLDLGLSYKEIGMGFGYR